MKRNTINFVLNGIMAFVTIGLVATGLIIRYVLPPGSGRWRLLWGLGRHDWGDVHFWFSAGIIVLVLAHVALHWPWVCATILCLLRRGETGSPSRDSSRWNLIGIGFLTLIIATVTGLLWIARISVQEIGAQDPSDGAKRHEWEGHLAEDDAGFLRGSMTLTEAAVSAHISVDTLRQRLGLPADFPAQEKLGQVCRNKGISMTEARHLIAAPE